MNSRPLSIEEKQQRSLARNEYNHLLKRLAHERLGGVCSQCGSADEPKIRFRNLHDPQKPKLTRHPAILASRILRDPGVAALVGLFCRPCRTRLRFDSLRQPSISTSTPQGSEMELG